MPGKPGKYQLPAGKARQVPVAYRESPASTSSLPGKPGTPTRACRGADRCWRWATAYWLARSLAGADDDLRKPGPNLQLLAVKHHDRALDLLRSIPESTFSVAARSTRCCPTSAPLIYSLSKTTVDALPRLSGSTLQYGAQKQPSMTAKPGGQ